MKSVSALSSRSLRPARKRVKSAATPSVNWPTIWRIMFVVLVLMIGLRHQVGGDWYNYASNFITVSRYSYEEVLKLGDPGYNLLTWSAARYNFGMYFVNTTCAVIFAWGLVTFCLAQPRSWLALTVAIPYMVIVVAMGYTRQGVSIGLGMLGLVALSDRKMLTFAFFIVIAASFHKTAVILMPLAALANSKNRWISIAWVGLFSIVLSYLFLQESVDALKVSYIDVQIQSAGAAIRVFMNAIPAGLFILFRQRFEMAKCEKSFWIWMSLIALAFVVWLQISSSSTVVDRMALYFIPLQIFVFSRLPDTMGSLAGNNRLWVQLVVAYCALVQFIWLFYAVNAGSWLPYQFYPWVLLTQ